MPQSHRAQVVAARRVAEAAVARFALPEGRLTFVTLGENATFRHDSPAGAHLVRVHRPQRHGVALDSRAAIVSELAWLTALRADTPLQVPRALEARDGEFVVEATAGDQTRLCTVLEWMPGRIHEDTARPVHFRRLGEAMARLHAHADAWTPPHGFVRIEWDHEAFFGAGMIYGELPARECWERLPPALHERFDEVSERMRGVLAEDGDAGLIHADLHMGNVVFEGDAAKPIDFDDCGFGPRLYDLAVAVWERRDEPDHEECLDALLAGYTPIRSIDISGLDDFIAMRQVGFDLWYTGTAHTNPKFAERLDIVHRWSSDMLDLVLH